MNTRRIFVWASRGLSFLAIVSFLVSGLLLAFTPKTVLAGNCETLNADCGNNNNKKDCCANLVCVSHNNQGHDESKCLCPPNTSWNGTSCVENPPAPFCGDNIVNNGEECDGSENCTSCLCNEGFHSEGGVCVDDGTTDNCPDDPLKTEAGVCGCGVADVDSDLDGAYDCQETCVDDPLKTEPGQCGCGIADIDTDGDGVADCNDACPLDKDYAELGDGWLVMNNHCYPEHSSVELNEPVSCVPAAGGGYLLMWALNNPNVFDVPVNTGGTILSCTGSTIPAGGSILCYSPDGPTTQTFTWSSNVGSGSSTSALECDTSTEPETPIVPVVIPVTAAGGPIVVEDTFLIPVTGADATLNYALLQQLTLNFGVMFSGLAMLTGGIAKKSKEE